MPVKPTLTLQTSQNQPILEDKNIKKSDKCLKALQGFSISLSTLGAVTTIAIAIIFAVAPLLIPAIIFKAVLLAGSALLLLGVALAIGAIAKHLKGRVPPKTEQLQNELFDFRKQQAALLGQVQRSEAELTRAGTDKQEIERKLQDLQVQLQDKNEELNSVQRKKAELENLNDPQGLLRELEDREELVVNLREEVEHLKKINNGFKTTCNQNVEAYNDLKNNYDNAVKERDHFKTEFDLRVICHQQAVDQVNVHGITIHNLHDNIQVLKNEINLLKDAETRLLTERASKQEEFKLIEKKIDDLIEKHKVEKENYIQQNLADKFSIENLTLNLNQSIEEKKKIMANFRETANTDISKLQLNHADEVEKLNENIEQLKEKIKQVESEERLTVLELTQARLQIQTLTESEHIHGEIEKEWVQKKQEHNLELEKLNKLLDEKQKEFSSLSEKLVNAQDQWNLQKVNFEDQLTKQEVVFDLLKKDHAIHSQKLASEIVGLNNKINTLTEEQNTSNEKLKVLQASDFKWYETVKEAVEEKKLLDGEIQRLGLENETFKEQQLELLNLRDKFEANEEKLKQEVDTLNLVITDSNNKNLQLRESEERLKKTIQIMTDTMVDKSELETLKRRVDQKDDMIRAYATKYGVLEEIKRTNSVGNSPNKTLPTTTTTRRNSTPNEVKTEEKK